MIYDFGYPKRSGNDKEDMEEMYNFVCELSDRLKYLFSQIEKNNGGNNNDV